MAKKKQDERPKMRLDERPIGSSADELAAVVAYLPAGAHHARAAIELLADLPPRQAYRLAEQILWAAGYAVPAVRMRACAPAGLM